MRGPEPSRPRGHQAPRCPPLRCGAPTSAPRCAIPAQLPQAPRTPPPRLPGGGPRARRHHDTGHRYPPECPGPRATPGPPAPDPSHPTAAPRPSPCGLAPLPPARRGGPRRAWARRDGRPRLAPRPRPAWPAPGGGVAPHARGDRPPQPAAAGAYVWPSAKPPGHHLPVAGTRGPAGPRGPPAGHGARGTAPQAGHTRCGPCSARRPGGLGGLRPPVRPPRRGSLARDAGGATEPRRRREADDRLAGRHRAPGTPRARRPGGPTARARALRTPPPLRLGRIARRRTCRRRRRLRARGVSRRHPACASGHTPRQGPQRGVRFGWGSRPKVRGACRQCFQGGGVRHEQS